MTSVNKKPNFYDIASKTIKSSSKEKVIRMFNLYSTRGRATYYPAHELEHEDKIIKKLINSLYFHDSYTLFYTLCIVYKRYDVLNIVDQDFKYKRYNIGFKFDEISDIIKLYQINELLNNKFFRKIIDLIIYSNVSLYFHCMNKNKEILDEIDFDYTYVNKSDLVYEYILNSDDFKDNAYKHYLTKIPREERFVENFNLYCSFNFERYERVLNDGFIDLNGGMFTFLFEFAVGDNNLNIINFIYKHGFKLDKDDNLEELIFSLEILTLLSELDDNFEDFIRSQRHYLRKNLDDDAFDYVSRYL